MPLTTRTIHLYQFRFCDTTVLGPYALHLPPYLSDGWGSVSRNLSRPGNTAVEPEGALGIGASEYQCPKKLIWTIVCFLFKHVPFRKQEMLAQFLTW